MLRAATTAASRRTRAVVCQAAPQINWRSAAVAPASSRCSLHSSSPADSSHRHRARILGGSSGGARKLLTLGGAAIVTFAAVAYLLPSGPASNAEEQRSGPAKRTRTASTATESQRTPASLPPAASSPTPAASASAPDEVEPSPSHADHAQCRACRDGGEEAISAFFKKHSDAAAAAAEAAASTASSASSSSPAAASASPCPPCFAYSHSLCPLNRAEVGRASWAYLHTLAAYYPASPTERQQNEMGQLLSLYMKYYPCGYCADRALEQIEREPVAKAVGSQRELSRWMCRMHNEVNERLGKPIFDCEFVDRRWRDGPPTGECD